MHSYVLQGICCLAICGCFEVFSRHQLSPSDLMASILNHRGWLRYAFQRICLLAFTGIGLLLLRLRLMGVTLPVFTKFDNPAAASETPSKQLTFGYLTSLNAWLLLAPCKYYKRPYFNLWWYQNEHMFLACKFFQRRSVARGPRTGLFSSQIESNEFSEL